MQGCLFTHPGPGANATAGSWRFCAQPRGHGRLLLVEKPHSKHRPHAAAARPKQPARLICPRSRVSTAGTSSAPRSITHARSTAPRATSLTNNHLPHICCTSVPFPLSDLAADPRNGGKGKKHSELPGSRAASHSLPRSGGSSASCHCPSLEHRLVVVLRKSHGRGFGEPGKRQTGLSMGNLGSVRGSSEPQRPDWGNTSCCWLQCGPCRLGNKPLHPTQGGLTAHTT